MPFAQGKQGRLYWRVDGRSDAPTLLLLNSLGTDMAMWDGIVPLLHDRLRIVRMDTRGHGASDVVAGDYTVDALAEDALAVLDMAGAKRAVACGLSLGGMIALRATLSAPDRIAGVVAANTSAQVPADPWRDRAAIVRRDGMGAIVDAVMERFFSETFRAASPPQLATARATFLATSPEGYASCCMAISSVGMIDELASIACPALVINGRLDAATPPAEHGDRIAAAIANARTVTLDAGHISAIEQPQAFAAAVEAFVAETAGAIG